MKYYKLKRREDPIDDELATIMAYILILLIPAACVVSGIVTIGRTFKLLPLIISGKATSGQITDYICWGIGFFVCLGTIICGVAESRKLEDDKADKDNSDSNKKEK